jgi:hypothetical protein
MNKLLSVKLNGRLSPRRAAIPRGHHGFSNYARIFTRRGDGAGSLSAKMQLRLVNGSTVLANTNALDEKSARTGDAVRAPAPAPLTGNGVATRSPKDPASSFRFPSSYRIAVYLLALLAGGGVVSRGSIGTSVEHAAPVSSRTM